MAARDLTIRECPDCRGKRVEEVLDRNGTPWLACRDCGCRFPPEEEIEEEGEDLP